MRGGTRRFSKAALIGAAGLLAGCAYYPAPPPAYVYYPSACVPGGPGPSAAPGTVPSSGSGSSSATVSPTESAPNSDAPAGTGAPPSAPTAAATDCVPAAPPYLYPAPAYAYPPAYYYPPYYWYPPVGSAGFVFVGSRFHHFR